MIRAEYKRKIKRGACIAAAVVMLGACGQADKAGTSAAETAAEVSSEAETTADKAFEESAAEEEKNDKEDTAADEKEEQSAKDESQEEVNDASGEEESDKAEEESPSEAPEENAAQADADAPAQNSEKSVKDIYGEIEQSVALNSPMLVPDDFIMNYYGIDVSTLDEYVFSMSEAATSAETVVVLKAKDAGSTGALSASLQTVIDQKRSEMENYLPDQFQIVDKSSVQVKGNYVYLVISEQADAIIRIIQADIQ